MNDSVTNTLIDANIINEDQWLKNLFLISDMQIWLSELELRLIYQLPVKNKKKLLRKTHYLTASALAHILERHYYKINRYPNAGKFIIPVAAIAGYIRDIASEQVTPVPGSCNVQRVFDTRQHIGFDQDGKATSIITVISDGGGKIITAFPGTIALNLYP